MADQGPNGAAGARGPRNQRRRRQPDQSSSGPQNAEYSTAPGTMSAQAAARAAAQAAGILPGAPDGMTQDKRYIADGDSSRRVRNRSDTEGGPVAGARANGRGRGGSAGGRSMARGGQPQQVHQQHARHASTATNGAASAPPNAHAAVASHTTDLRYADIAGLSPESKRAMAEGFGYESTTSVQKATMEPALAGRDLLARARTGTGKTLAFLLPTIERVRAQRGTSLTAIGAVVVSPTRELATQIANEARKVLKYHHGLGVSLVIGGTNIRSEQRRLAQGPNTILVCTPGRFMDHVKTTPGFTSMLQAVSVAVLDECDRLLEMGFRNEIVKMLKTIPDTQRRQTLLFSATMPSELGTVVGLALRKDHLHVDCVGADAPETATLAEQAAVIVPKDEWLPRLAQVISDGTVTPNYKIMVFCTTARTAGFLAGFFDAAGLPGVSEIHSRMSQSKRDKVSQAFRASLGSVVMFTSDVSARGVDYPGTTLIVQLGLPSSRETYIHRLGRTARAGTQGQGLLLLCDYETAFLTKGLKGLPVAVKDLGPMPAQGEAQWYDAVTQVRASIERNEELHTRAEQAYQAWLGYMNGSMKMLGWDKPTLVREAANYAMQLGLSRTPALEKRTVAKMGLKGVPGLVLR